jgi:hypothetical protein
MFTNPKRIVLAVAATATALSLAGCASTTQNVVGNPVYTLAAIDGEGTGRNAELAAALDGTPTGSIGGGTPVSAAVTVDLVRYNSPIIGLFYGGPDHAALSVTLTDMDGLRIEAFDLFVGVDANGTEADAVIAAKAAGIIAARAANAFPPIRSVPKSTAGPVVAAATPSEPADAPIILPSDPEPQSTDPLCIIDADGNCIPL